MSTLQEDRASTSRRLERLEEWRVQSESTAAMMLERVGHIAATLTTVATTLERLADGAAHERGAARERRRMRAAAAALVGLALTAAGIVAGRGGF